MGIDGECRRQQTAQRLLVLTQRFVLLLGLGEAPLDVEALTLLVCPGLLTLELALQPRPLSHLGAVLALEQLPGSFLLALLAYPCALSHACLLERSAAT